MKYLLHCLLVLLLISQTARPNPSATVDVWPENKMPGNVAKKPEAEKPSKDSFHRITNVSNPTLTLFPAPEKNAPAVIVCPGGGYSYVVIDKEGTGIAAWLNSIGFSAAVLKYRNPDNRAGALQDLQRALRLVRTRAGEWNIDPKRLGVIGFSAGGNLAAKASNLFDRPSYQTIDGVDRQSCRPDFALLVYPAYLDGKKGGLSEDLDLKADIPPTLIVHSEDDENFVSGSKLYAAALAKAKIPHQFILYQTGGHGYALHCTKEARAWPKAAEEWLHKTAVR